MTTHGPNKLKLPVAASPSWIKAIVPQRTLLWSLVVPTGIAVVALIVGIGYFTPRAVVDSAVDEAIVRAEQTAKQMQTLRSFYSENVVARAGASGTRSSPDYAETTDTIPVPTTFLLDVARAFSNKDIAVDLVSPYPWENRENRVLDDFQRDAWAYLTENPKERFVRREFIDGRETLRVAVADSMEASCVACHNTSSSSPKTDWKIGDVRGLIEVERPLDTIVTGAQALSWRLVLGAALGGVALLGVLVMIGFQFVRPLQELSRVIKRIGGGKVHVDVPHVRRRDELGTVARALHALQIQTGERARAEARISHMAHHDALTNLPNRVLFQHHLDTAIATLGTGNNFAVLCLDLDHFKAVNDTLGHPVGDGLLVEVGRRLSEASGREGAVARLGGDEFAVLELGIASADEASQLAQKIIEAFSVPFDIGGHQVVTNVSIGIAMSPDDGLDGDELMKNADMALYRSKTDGRGVYRFFEPEMDARMQARRALELDLRCALANGEFELHYQPIVSLTRSEVTGFEALLRWTHPVRGMVPPSDFIELAEEIGAIESIGLWVIRTACMEAASWPDDIKIAVNLSPVQLKSKTLVLNVATALAAAGIPAQRLELEITEAVMLQDTTQTLAILHQLRALGVSIAMDDFGTGYSSFSYLRKFPFDKIKIDRCFVSEIGDADESLAIIRAVSGLGTSFGMSTTAEGVETREQLLKLKKEGCDEVQGYLFSKPRPAAEITALPKRVHPSTRRSAA